MTWFREEDPDSSVIRLRYEDGQDQAKGPFTVDWPNAPTKRFGPDGRLITPDWQSVAMSEAKTEAQNGNSGRAIQMLADAIAGNVEEGQP